MNITDSAGSLKHLVAENESLKGRLEEYQHMFVMKEKEILELRLQIAGGNEIKSDFDNQVMEMKLLYNYLSDAEQDAEGTANIGMSQQQNATNALKIKNQLHDLKQQYARLQTHLTDLQTQILNLNTRNLLLQQQNGRIAELEILLADAEQERDEWKALANLKE